MEPPTTELVRMDSPPAYAKYRPVASFKTRVPLEKAKGYWHFSNAAAKLGLALIAAPGTGKSRLLGRIFGYAAVKQRKPLVMIDPTGGSIDNLLDVIARLPLAWRQAIWPRLTYVDVGARDYLVPPPLYYRLGAQDTLFEIANRFPAILKRQDPDLQSAPILGWNALYECAIHAGMIATALGRQVDFVADLVMRPGSYKEELKQILESQKRNSTRKVF